MSAQQAADGFVTIYEETVHNPLGLHMESGIPVPGKDWQVFVDEDDKGAKTIHLGDEQMSAEVASELGRALCEGADMVDPPKFLGGGITLTDLAIICSRLGISMVDMVEAMKVEVRP